MRALKTLVATILLATATAAMAQPNDRARDFRPDNRPVTTPARVERDRPEPVRFEPTVRFDHERHVDQVPVVCTVPILYNGGEAAALRAQIATLTIEYDNLMATPRCPDHTRQELALQLQINTLKLRLTACL